MPDDGQIGAGRELFQKKAFISLEDLERFRKESGGKVDFTIGSALDLFGGKIPYAEVCKSAEC